MKNENNENQNELASDYIKNLLDKRIAALKISEDNFIKMLQKKEEQDFLDSLPPTIGPQA